MVLVLVFLFLSNLYAYQSSLTAEGNKLYWPNHSISIAIKNGTADLPNEDQIIKGSVDQFLTTTIKTPINISINSSSLNEIRFENPFIYGSAVVGITELTYNPSGAINKAVIRLNDDYNFKNTRPTSSANKEIFLADVVTHELGHFLGLSHSEVLDSSMFYTTFTGQNDLSPDDMSGLIHKYGTTNSSQVGIIKGYVKGGNQIGILGAHVQIIERNSGAVVGVITDEEGYFEARGLSLNKAYYIYTSPTKNPESLPGFLANIQSRFCPGPYTGSFFSACGRENEGYPQEIILSNTKPTVDIGIVTINCGLKVSEDYLEKKTNSTLSNVELISSDEATFSGRAFVGYFPKSSTGEVKDSFTLDLSGVNPGGKNLKINVLGYPFGGRVKFNLIILKKDGNVVRQENIPGTNISLEHPLNTSPINNNFNLEINAEKLTDSALSSTFPSYELFSSDTHMPYLILIELTPPVGESEDLISDNESCLDAPFAFRVDNAQIPSLEDSEEELVQNGTACGSIDGDGSGGNSGSNLLITCCGILFLQILFSLAKKAKIFLS